MIDPDLKKYLDSISLSLKRIERGSVWWRGIINGVLGGFGYVIGFVVALVVLGWVLNIIGVIPAFRREVDGWRSLLQQTQQKQITSPASRTGSQQ